MTTSHLAIGIFTATVMLLLAISAPAAEKPEVLQGGMAEVTAVYG